MILYYFSKDEMSILKGDNKVIILIKERLQVLKTTINTNPGSMD